MISLNHSFDSNNTNYNNIYPIFMEILSCVRPLYIHYTGNMKKFKNSTKN